MKLTTTMMTTVVVLSVVACMAVVLAMEPEVALDGGLLLAVLLLGINDGTEGVAEE